MVSGEQAGFPSQFRIEHSPSLAQTVCAPSLNIFIIRVRLLAVISPRVLETVAHLGH